MRKRRRKEEREGVREERSEERKGRIGELQIRK